MTTRRRVLSILAGAAALPMLGSGAGAAPQHWRGIALGAEARIVLDHPNAPALIAASVQEIQRLEKIFSLYLSDSQLSKLNREGSLESPAFELVELLSLCSSIHARTSGAFDPTVQSLWALYAQSFAAGTPPSPSEISETLGQTGWAQLRYSPAKIRFEKSGMALTLNGIAQGYIADRIVALLRRGGVENALVNTGEIASLGAAENNSGWPVRLSGVSGDPLMLSNMAVATSAPAGTTFDSEASVGHIIDPRTGVPGGKWRSVSVLSGSAAEADGLSTAFCLMQRPEIVEAKGSAQVFLS